MTKEEIYNGNKLIAEFLGWEDPWPDENLVSYTLPKWWMDDFKIVDDWDALTPDQMLFNSSFDWLMPAIYKIYQSDDYINYKNISGQFTKSIEIYPGNILKTYHEVAEFIIWYNKNNKND